MSIVEFVCIMNGLFWHSSDIYSSSHWNHLEAKKIFISEQVYVVNLHPTVMALHFKDTRCAIRTSPIGWSQHQHFRLIRTQHLALSAWPLFYWEHINEHAACAKCYVPINRKYWCCDWPIVDALVPHRVPPKGSVITAGLRLLTYTFSEIKVYFFF